MGLLKTTQTMLSAPSETLRDGMKLLTSPAPASSLYPSLPTSALTKLNIANSERSTNFGTWKKRAESEPYLEVDFDRSPAHLASCRNYLFSVDDQEMLSIFIITSSNEIKLENNLKMSFPPSSIAVNVDFMAVSFANLNKKYLKNKKARATGVTLFRRDLSLVDFNGEKPVECVDFKNPVRFFK